MKQLTSIILLTFIFGSVYGQIGINTDNPLELFHVDGAKDNSPSPTSAQLSNDVVITSDGNIGMGTLTPSVKLDITNTGVIPPLRIVDGSTMPNKVLESDADGVASWTYQPPSYTKMYRASVFGQQFLNSTLTPLILDNNIIIPQPGKYLLTIQWWGYNMLDLNGLVQSGYVYVKLKNSATNLDQIEYYTVATAVNVITFTTSLYLGDRLTGDEIEIDIKPSIGAGPTGNPSLVHWQLINDPSRTDLMPRVIVYSI